MVIVPLVLSSVILGVANAGSLDHLKRMGVRLFPYFVGTTIISIMIGIFLTSLFQPGITVDASTVEREFLTNNRDVFDNLNYS